ncbi:MAG: nucleotidyltransferase domain-containing protein [Thermomicrobiales bacterium]
MFSVEDRERIRELITEKAQMDSRLVAAAAVGGSAAQGDRWSDLDLTFGVADEVPVEAVLTDWTRDLLAGFDAAVLFDLPVGSTIYRVFLLPGNLQVDLSFTPAAEFGARGPRFSLLFGTAVERPFAPPPSPEHIFGLGVHHAVRGHICIQRGRLWQAEYWIHGVRDQALALACCRLGLEASNGREFDSLPSEVLDPFAGALARNVTASELRRALAVATTGLLREAGDTSELATRVRPELEELCRPAPTGIVPADPSTTSDERRVAHLQRR